MMADEKMIDLNGVELGYSARVGGAGKPAIVFTHGYVMRATGAPYAELLDLLAERFAVYALDLRGHGASTGAASGFSYEALADDVAAFAEVLGLDDPVFVGHSFGAVIGLYAEIRHPGTFSALALLSPGPADHRSDPVEALNFLIENGHDKEKLRGGFGAMFTRPPGPLLDATLDAVTLVDAGVHRAQQEQNPRFSIDDRLGDIAAPALLLCGESDHVVPPAKQHDMARKLRRSKEIVFAADGHMLPIEDPAVVAREIAAFVEHDRERLAAAAR